MRISDWSSDVCSSDLIVADRRERRRIGAQPAGADAEQVAHWTLPPPEPAPPLVATRARNCASTIEAMPSWRSDAIESAVRASAISRKLSVALDPKISSPSFAWRIEALSWQIGRAHV